MILMVPLAGYNYVKKPIDNLSCNHICVCHFMNAMSLGGFVFQIAGIYVFVQKLQWLCTTEQTTIGLIIL